MPYDESKDPFRTIGDAVLANGSKGAEVEPDDENDLTRYVKAVVLLSAGTLSYIPIDNADDAPISYTDDLPVGWVSPHRVRRVLETGTTATVATVED